MQARRAEGSVLEFGVLGLLHESPLHGYELRKRLNTSLGFLRAFSYGSLYPALRRMQAIGWITVDDSTAAAKLGSRSRVVYTLTADGKEHFAGLLAEAGPAAWEDDAFGVHMRFFAQTDAATRLRILEGRRRRVEERREGLRAALARTRERLDTYTLKLQEHGLESVEREVRWLNELIATERQEQTPDPGAATATAIPPLDRSR
ncbi:MAG: PadR family transcriptional regulator [Mycobacteriales bacterium]